ncbi:hypothetical protein [Pelagibaculum spongiae]|nr:hypothetical protein [Pelagibaculum spongiae]
MKQTSALAEDSITEHLSVDVGSWIDEESSYHAFLGSRSINQQ